MVNPLRADPTRTTLLRNKFVADMGARFTRVSNASWRFMVTDDSLVLNYEFKSDPAKLEAYKKWLKEQVDKQLIVVSNTETPWTDEYIQSSYKAATVRSWEDVRKKQGKGTASEAKKEFMSSFSLPVTQHRLQLLYTRCWDALVGVTQQMGAELSRTLADGLVHGLGAREVGKNIAAAIGVSKNRAMTIARTELINAYAEGQLDTFDKLGISKLGAMVEHLTAGDKRVCPRCQSLNGKIYNSTADARGLIPVHPNAVFAGSSFMPYGECEELVRAWYSGPSVVFTLRGGIHRTTIGPNHPVMTRRGMVKAAQLRESDEVLYDNRGDRSAPSLDLEKIPLVEDVFKSVLSITPNSRIVASSSDLHGDKVFCKGEVQAVRPTNGLLRVLDSFGIEKFRQDNFTRSDTNLESRSRSGFSSLNSSFKRILLASSSGVSSRNISNHLVDSHFDELSFNSRSVDTELSTDKGLRLSSQVHLSNCFKWEKIHSIAFGMYEGLAFDATTASSLYCSGGVVVSNCRCAWIPYVDISEYVGEGKK